MDLISNSTSMRYSAPSTTSADPERETMQVERSTSFSQARRRFEQLDGFSVGVHTPSSPVSNPVSAASTPAAESKVRQSAGLYDAGALYGSATAKKLEYEQVPVEVDLVKERARLISSPTVDENISPVSEAGSTEIEAVASRLTSVKALAADLDANPTDSTLLTPDAPAGVEAVVSATHTTIQEIEPADATSRDSGTLDRAAVDSETPIEAYPHAIAARTQTSGLAIQPDPAATAAAAVEARRVEVGQEVPPSDQHTNRGSARLGRLHTIQQENPNTSEPENENEVVEVSLPDVEVDEAELLSQKSLESQLATAPNNVVPAPVETRSAQPPSGVVPVPKVKDSPHHAATTVTGSQGAMVESDTSEKVSAVDQRRILMVLGLVIALVALLTSLYRISQKTPAETPPKVPVIVDLEDDSIDLVAADDGDL